MHLFNFADEVAVVEEKINPLIPHPVEIVVGLIAFTLLFLVLKSKVVPMFEKAYAERTAAIQGGIEKAEKAQLEAARALASYNEQLSSARDESSRLREEARVQGAAIMEELRAKGQVGRLDTGRTTDAAGVTQ